MNKRLFRPEAMAAQTQRLHGDVLVLPSLKVSVIAILVSLWIVLLVLWLLNGNYARKETVQGWLEPDKGVIKVFATATAGQIKQILVSPGDVVEKGQPLVIINGDRVLADGRHLEDRLLAEFNIKEQLLQQQIARSESIHQLRMSDVSKQIASIEQELVQTGTQLNLLQQRFTLLDGRLLNMSAMLSEGHITQEDYNRTLAEKLSLQSDIAGLNRIELDRRNSRDSLQANLQIYPQEAQNRVAQLRTQLSDIAQSIADVHGRRAHIINATASGVISNIQVSQGQYTNANLPLMTLLPKDSGMQVRLLVPVRAAGFLAENQPVSMRYDAFPYQKFGLYDAYITDISDSALLPNEISELAINIKEPVYLVRAELAKRQVQAFGQLIPLKAGMTLSADIKLAERSIIEWLLEPLFSIKGRL